MNFATALREEREAIGLSQSRLAASAGYDHSYISRLESDLRDPTREAVLSLCSAMNSHPQSRDRLLMSAGFMPKDPAALLNERVLADAYRVLSDPALGDGAANDFRSGIAMCTRQARMTLVRIHGSPTDDR